eukprot:TRINITY_DN57040_c0_g1_i1.p1 TRINITY_DN57040_c0_g1~~TRINITY_DN57040_c0_g1_i1.p1  ORF type:complete len:1070 (-),score=105.02 TRINITY_DN57040_c0_g1_i1:373-3582(-)
MAAASGRGATLLFLVLPGFLYVVSHAACLEEAIPPHELRNVTVDIPLGIFVNPTDPAAMLLSHIMRILAEEKLGYNTVLYPGEYFYSEASIRALAGCDPPDTDFDDCVTNRSKDASPHLYHLVMQLWQWGRSEHARWQKNLPHRAPELLPDVGFRGMQGLYVTKLIMELGLNKSGQVLSSYLSYGAERFDPAGLFTNIDDIDSAVLLSCHHTDVMTALTDWSNAPEDYKKMLLSRLTCSRDGWWLLPPACKDQPHRCAPCILKATFGLEEVWQKLIHHNLAIAVGLAQDEASFERLTNEYNVLKRSQFPDLHTLPHKWELVAFPEHNVEEWNRGLKSTQAPSRMLDKWASSSLNRQAVRALEVARRVAVPMHAMADMLTLLGEENKTSYEAACEWLRRSNSWEGWIPSALYCVAGQGLYAGDEPVTNVTNELRSATRCHWCPPGRASIPGTSDLGDGLLCQLCTAGKFQPDPMGQSCTNCSAGEFSKQGQGSCSSCEPGTYSSIPGAASCIQCPVGLVTDGMGKTTQADCVCDLGYYKAPATSERPCRSCGWFQTTAQMDTTSETGCMWDKTQVFVGMAILLSSVVPLVGLACWFQSRRWLKKVREDDAMQEALLQGFRSISRPRYPMCLMPMICFCEMTTDDFERCHEGARDNAKLLCLDSASNIKRFKASGRKILFFSYTWTSWQRLGPNKAQIACMKHAAQRILQQEGLEAEKFFIWLDVLGIPQVNDDCKGLAVNSLYIYASRADYLVIVAPDGVHADTGQVVGLEAYKSRAWCRLEQLAHMCAHGIDHIWICRRPGTLEPINEEWIRDVMYIFDGEVTCCRLKHPHDKPCDKQLMVPTVLAMYTDLLVHAARGAMAGRHSQLSSSRHSSCSSGKAQDPTAKSIQMVWDLMRQDVNRVFPKAFNYLHESGRVTKQRLFGPAIRIIQECIKTDCIGTFQALDQMKARLSEVSGNSNPALVKASNSVWFEFATSTLQQNLRRGDSASTESGVEDDDWDSDHEPDRVMNATTTLAQRIRKGKATLQSSAEVEGAVGAFEVQKVEVLQSEVSACPSAPPTETDENIVCI